MIILDVCMCLIQTGLTPLAYASKWGPVKAVHLLLDRGADINQVYCTIEFLHAHPTSRHSERASCTCDNNNNIYNSVSMDNIVRKFILLREHWFLEWLPIFSRYLFLI